LTKSESQTAQAAKPPRGVGTKRAMKKILLVKTLRQIRDQIDDVKAWRSDGGNMVVYLGLNVLWYVDLSETNQSDVGEYQGAPGDTG
jgi:hypothetical protein